MRFTTLFGLPADPLLVHLPIVLIPLVGLGAIAMAFSRSIRDRIGWIVLGLAVVAFVGTHLAVESGEALDDSVKHSAALAAHTSLADSLQPLAFALLAVIALLMAVHWWEARSARERAGGADEEAGAVRRALPAWVSPVVGVLVVATSIVTSVQLVRVGHNGAKASWQSVDVASNRSEHDGDRDGN